MRIFSIIAALSSWDWLDFVGLSLVVLGVAGELAMLFEFTKRFFGVQFNPTGFGPLDKWKNMCEVIFAGMVALGCALEIVSLPAHVKEVADARLLTAKIETTNSQLVADNFVLRLKVATLDLQIIEASNNIVKNDVRNWPISEMNATVWFTVMGTNMDEVTNLPSGRKAEMNLWKNEREGTSLDTLEGGNNDIWGHIAIPTLGTVDRRIYRLQLHSFNFSTAAGINPPLVRTIDDVHIVRVDLNFLPRDSEIANGRIILTVNNVTKYFDIPRQDDTNSMMGWRNDFVCWFVGTNGVKSAEKEFLYLRQ